MSRSKLHSEKCKSKRGIYGEDFNNYPFKVRKYYDRHCGTNEDRIEKIEREDRENLKEFKKDIDILGK